jgi:hypothetical protein
MSNDYRDEDVLQHAREAFQETIALKIKHLRHYIAKGKNPKLTGDYIEEIVRSFVRRWIGSLQLRKGTFYSHEFQKSGETPLEIDGIVWNPLAGPAILEENDFIVVHPVYCTSVIEIKTSINYPIAKFQKRLQKIYHTYMHWGTTTQVMGIVISDPDPESKSTIDTNKRKFFAFHYFKAGWCPIFILFKEKDNEYTPYEPAIDAMIRAIYTNQNSAGNFM